MYMLTCSYCDRIMRIDIIETDINLVKVMYLCDCQKEPEPRELVEAA